MTAVEDLRSRLRRANEDMSTKRQAYEDAIELRNELVIQALDEFRLSYGQVSRLTRLSQTRVVQIAAKGRTY